MSTLFDWRDPDATRGGLQSVEHALSDMQMAQTWAMKIEEAMKSPEPGA